MIRASRCLLLILLLGGLLARETSAGSAGFAFLEIPTGARASALGGAYTSLVQGAEAAFWNPAGLDGVHGIQVMGGHYELYQNLRHDHFAVARTLLGGGVSGSVRALYSGPIDERDEVGNLIGSFGVYDLELGLGYGRAIAGGLSAGGSARVFRERIADAGVSTYGFGLGATWEPPAAHGLRMSLVGENMGRDAQYFIDGRPGARVPLPLALQAGVSYRFDLAEHAILRSALETRITRGRNAVAMIGAELGNLSGAAVRLGLRMNDQTSGVSMGAGYALGAIRFDYAFVPLRLDLGDTHRFSFSAQF